MSPVAAGTAGVRQRYARLAADVSFVRSAPAGDHDPAVPAGLVCAEARWLDHGNYPAWLAWCAADMALWVPLSTADPDPGTDQSFLLDDRRRLDERVWRMLDPNAWALVPAPMLTRSVGAVEAWDQPGDEILVTSTLSIHIVRTGAEWATTGRQIHRLRSSPDDPSGWQLVSKILLLPALSIGTPHLGWLL